MRASGCSHIACPRSSIFSAQGHPRPPPSLPTRRPSDLSPDTSTRHAATIYDANQVRLHLSFSTAHNGTIHIYVVDWDAIGRRETITVNDGSGPQTANITIDFSQSAWVNVPINVAAGGNVTVTVA